MEQINEVTADFKAAGLGANLVPGIRPALILVDPARAYTDPKSPLYAGVEDSVEQMRVLLDVARYFSIPIYITRVIHEFEGDGGQFARKVPATKCFAAGSPWAEVIEGFEHHFGETLVTKKYPSAFFGTDLASSLTARGVDTTIIAGLSTSGCIRATALDALQNGLVPLVVREAVGDRHSITHESNLLDIAAKIGQVISMQDISTYLKSIVN